MLKELKVGRGQTVPSPLTCPSTKKSDGTEELVVTGSVDGCSFLPDTQFVGTPLRMGTTQILSVGGFLAPWELPERGQSSTSNRH